MKTDWSHLEQYRVTTGAWASNPGCDYGQFIIPSVTPGRSLCVIATSGDPETPGVGDWEHVSAHVRVGAKSENKKTPNWDEMCQLKDLFWLPEETVIQYHPAASNYVNVHANVLHLWRPKNAQIPTPPTICV